jgi:hypothetical protein
MKNFNGLLIMLVVSQLLLFSVSFYEYFHNHIKLFFIINVLNYTYCVATLFVLLKYKNEDDAKSD